MHKLQEEALFYQEGVVTRDGYFFYFLVQSSVMGQKTILAGNKNSKSPNPALLGFPSLCQQEGEEGVLPNSGW